MVRFPVSGDRVGHNGNSDVYRLHEPLPAQGAVVGLRCLAEIRYAKHDDEQGESSRTRFRGIVFAQK